MASLEHDSGAKAAGEEHADYESDSEEGTSALALRRRVASDDEEDDEVTNNERRDDYYAEAHDGGPPAEEEDEEDESEEADEEGEEYEDAEDEAGIGDRRKDVNEDYADEDGVDEGRSHFREDARKAQGGVGTTTGVGKEGVAEEKKDAEPFVVPTAGAFYMHDDRFRYNGMARPRRSAGGRKLWEAKDEKPWVHDRFEELKLNDDSYPGQVVRGRRGRGRQGRVQGRGKDAPRVRGRGHREKVFDDSFQSSRRGLGRGRGLRRAKMDDYEFRDSRSVSQKVPSSSSHETNSLPATTPMQKPVPSQPASRPQEAGSKKPTISSMLNISSPPFFPTGTISQNVQGFVAGTSKGSEEKFVERDAPQARRLVNTSRSGMEREMTGFSSASVTRLPSNLGLNSSLAPLSNNGDVETGLHRSLARSSSTPQQQLSKSGSGSIAQQQRIVRAEAAVQHVIEQPLLSSAPQPSSRGAPPTTQSSRVQSLSQMAPQQSSKGTSPASQTVRMQQPHQQLQVVNQGQISSGQPVQPQAVVSPVSFPAKPAADLKAAPASGGSNLGSGAIGRGTQAAAMPAGRGALVYGSSSLTNGLRSVVQFAGQPQAGLGVPTVGVALPGYSSQPQFSFPNSEVTWIPILAGGGSLNSNYSSPYIAVDGGPSGVYYAQQPSQVSAFPPTGDLNGSKTAAANSFKPPSRTEPDDLGQQRRRYSQMTFGEERR